MCYFVVCILALLSLGTVIKCKLFYINIFIFVKSKEAFSFYKGNTIQGSQFLLAVFFYSFISNILLFGVSPQAPILLVTCEAVILLG